MTKRTHRRGLLPPRRPVKMREAYGVDPIPLMHSGRTLANPAAVLDRTRPEIYSGTPDDPGQSPMRSEAIRALLVLIEFAQAHTYYDGHTPDPELDLTGFCQDAELTERQTEVVLMVGDGWGVSSIAEKLEISRQAVSTHLARGRGKLIRLVLPADAALTRRLPMLYTEATHKHAHG